MRGERRWSRTGLGGLLACAALALALPGGAAAKEVTYTAEVEGGTGAPTTLTLSVDFRKGEPVKVTRYRFSLIGECPGGLPWPFDLAGPQGSSGVKITKGGAFTYSTTNGRPAGSRSAHTIRGKVSPNGKRVTGTVSGTFPVGGAQCVGKGLPFEVEK